MDPLTALSLAANILAIVDVSASLIHTTWQISKTGVKAEHVELEDQTIVVRRLQARLKPGLNANTAGLSQDDEDLIKLCEQSEDVSKKLLEMLDSCKAKEGASSVLFDNFWRAVKSEWKEDGIKDMQNRLERIDAKAHRLITVRFSSRISKQLARLEKQFQILGISRAAELGDIEKAVNDLAKKGSDGDHVNRQLMLNAADRGGLGKDFAIQAGILGQLRFEEIDRRLHELSQRPSHEKSYLWLHDSSNGAKIIGKTPASLEAWLTSPEKLYWISGLPGSGKSTLMKFLYSSPRITGKLADWTQSNRFLMAAYFFWEVGNIALLRTQEGLLRSLLFQILRQCPELISEVYSDLWILFSDATPTGQHSLSSFAGSQVSLDVQQLLEKMKAACRCLASRNYYLFLVIDGLDEYDGKPSGVVQLIETLTELVNVKICVSSRADNAFLEAYGSMTTKLYVEDFNKMDITEYVRDRLESHPRFKDDDDRNTLGADLIKKVVDDSRGVFLWVRLVIEDLEEGLTDRNTILQLQRRLARLPKELEKFFDHMLDRVNEDYREDSASMLLVTYHAHDLLPTLACWFISERASELEGSHETRPTDSRHNHKRRNDINFRLRSYCRGLLVVQDLPLAAPYVSLPSSSLFGQKVNFLHRTVRDFLERPNVLQRLENWKPDNFDADELICKAIRAQVQTSPNSREYFAGDGPIATMLDIFVFHYKRLYECPAQILVAKDLRKDLAAVLSAQRVINGHLLSLPDLDDAAVGVTSHSPKQSIVAKGGKVNQPVPPQGSRRERLKAYFKAK